ncbi:MAG: hypothetical protein EPN99_00355 [Frankiales bacterium]|nr:MAG: hypothetical protein EPN99_00355 [Frankiales bacterium]
MSRTRLTALLAAAVGVATCIGPAGATSSSPTGSAPRALSLQAAAQHLLDVPDDAAREAWRASLLSGVTSDESTGSSAASTGPRDYARVTDAGDLDGDGRSDVLVAHDSGTTVRSGKDGRVLLRHAGSSLSPVPGAGAVKLLSVKVEYVDVDRGFAIDVHFEGLDGKGRSRWQHTATGTYTFTGAGPLGVTRVQSLPLLASDGMLDGAGRPALLLGGLSGTVAVMGSLTLEPALLSLSDGELQVLPEVRGMGRATPWVTPQTTSHEPQRCYTTSAPLGPLTRVGLLCGATPAWTVDVPLRGAYVEEAGDFDGDQASDVLVTTWGFERPQAREVARGTRVLSFADGSTVASGPLDTLTPLLADVSGDGQPDLMEVLLGDADVELRAVTVAGEEIWARRVALDEGGWTSAYSGYDLTGDGLADGLVIGMPDTGPGRTTVVDGRTGKAYTRVGVNDMLLPGLRQRGADLVVLGADRGRARATVLSGDRGATLLDVRVPGPTGLVSTGGAGAADLDRDGRRDLVVASRTDDVRVATAFSAAGRVLWQVREKAKPVRKDIGMVIVEAG